VIYFVLLPITNDEFVVIDERKTLYLTGKSGGGCEVGGKNSRVLNKDRNNKGNVYIRKG